MVSKRLTCIGMMSGTSLDGIDVALVETDGESVLTRGPSQTVTYLPEQRSLLRQALSDAIGVRARAERPGILNEAEQALTRWHADALASFLSAHALPKASIDVIGFHGQTVMHRPEVGLTVQLGDGALLAKLTQIPVVYDLRAADIAANGQGAPLVPAYHRALAQKLESRPVAFVNIGGVANITYVGPDDELIAFDTGPGNALIDDFLLARTRQAFDGEGSLAKQGRADNALVSQFLGHPYFSAPPPKSLDRNTFSGLPLDGLETANGAASLVAITVQSIAAAVKHLPLEPATWVICGGGRKNVAIMDGLRAQLSGVVKAEALALNGDSMEAEAWGFLAARSLAGLPISYPLTTGVSRALTGGVVAHPEN